MQVFESPTHPQEGAEASVIWLDVKSKEASSFKLQLKPGFTLQDLRYQIRSQSKLKDVRIFRIGKKRELLKTSDGDLDELTSVYVESQQRRTRQQIAHYRIETGKTKASTLLKPLSDQQEHMDTKQEGHSQAQREHTSAINNLTIQVRKLRAAFDGELVEGNPRTALECDSQNYALKNRKRMLLAQMRKNNEKKTKLRKDGDTAKINFYVKQAKGLASMTKDHRQQLTQFESNRCNMKMVEHGTLQACTPEIRTKTTFHSTEEDEVDVAKCILQTKGQAIGASNIKLPSSNVSRVSVDVLHVDYNQTVQLASSKLCMHDSVKHPGGEPTVVGFTSLSLTSGSQCNAVPLLQAALEYHGFVVLRAYVNRQEACSVKSAIYDHCCSTLRAMGLESLVRDGVPGLLEVKPWSRWYKTPRNWDGQHWGIKGHAGYNKCLGGGRMFSSASFLGHSELRDLQNRLRDINAALYGCLPHQCIPIPEGASVKLPGTTAWHDHLDGNRAGSFQNIISLCNSHCVVYPGSHKMRWNHGGKFYLVSDSDKSTLLEAGIKRVEVSMGVGDVLIMSGGKLVHGVPAVAKNSDVRCMSFSHFKKVI